MHSSWRVEPGFKNAFVIFQRSMNTICGSMSWMMVTIDFDVFIYVLNDDPHQIWLEEHIFGRRNQNGTTLFLMRALIFLKETDYMGLSSSLSVLELSLKATNSLKDYSTKEIFPKRGFPSRSAMCNADQVLAFYYCPNVCAKYRRKRAIFLSLLNFKKRRPTHSNRLWSQNCCCHCLRRRVKLQPRQIYTTIEYPVNRLKRQQLKRSR